MSQPLTGTGIWRCRRLSGVSRRDPWVTQEAVMRRALMTLAHVVAPVAASGPTGPMYANITERQQDNARHVLEQALKTVRRCVLSHSRHPRPVVVAHPRARYSGESISRLGRQQPHHDLRLAHLQAEDHAGHSALDRAGTHNVQCQSRFVLRCNRFRG